MACGSRRVTIQLVGEEAGPGTGGPKPFRGQRYEAIRTACLDEGILFQDPYFPAGPDALGHDELGPNSEKAKGVEWMRPHVMPGIPRAPQEFCAEPQFICEDMSRTDVCQGRLGKTTELLGSQIWRAVAGTLQLGPWVRPAVSPLPTPQSPPFHPHPVLAFPPGNCWFLAAAASLTLYPRLLCRVVPPGQSFQDGYAGVFHFQLWQFGHWVDVVVDDRLPVREGKLMFVRSRQRNEFWAPLLEKAYAKLHSSYEVMRGGHMNEAFVDFTGGVGEVLYLRQDLPGLFSAVRHALAKESLVGATALSDRGEHRTEDGLVKGHAYSVTGTYKVTLGFTKVRLLRLRNPWGRVEWTGAWSDSCPRWDALPKEWRDALLVKKEDGEFWMELKDFLRHFNTVQICSLSPEVLGPSPAGGGWHVHTFQGRWVPGFSSGGSQPGTGRPEGQALAGGGGGGRGRGGGPPGAGARGGGGRIPKCTVLLSLIQRNRRRLRAQGLTYLTVGFHVFQLLGLWDAPRGRELLPGLLRADRSPFCARRDVSRRCRLRPGHYLVVPSAARAGDEADFTLRVFSERRHTVPSGSPGRPEPRAPARLARFPCVPGREVDDVVSAELRALTVPYIPLERGLEQLFQELAGEPGPMPGPLERSGSGPNGQSFTLHHFQQLWGHLLEWQATFDKFDKDASGTMNSYELRLALNAAGFHLNNQLTQALTSRYRDSRLRVDFERFVSCAAQLTCIFREWCPGTGTPGWGWGCLPPASRTGCSTRPLCAGHCSQHLEGGEGVVCLTRRQ
ncbi:hypothetical protein GH733_012503, partial [Mirounga leonina]